MLSHPRSTAPKGSMRGIIGTQTNHKEVIIGRGIRKSPLENKNAAQPRKSAIAASRYTRAGKTRRRKINVASSSKTVPKDKQVSTRKTQTNVTFPPDD